MRKKKKNKTKRAINAPITQNTITSAVCLLLHVYSQKNRTSQKRINEKFAQSFSYIPVRMFTPGALTVKAQRVSQTNLHGSMSRAVGVCEGVNVTVVLSAVILLCGF